MYESEGTERALAIPQLILTINMYKQQYRHLSFVACYCHHF